MILDTGSGDIDNQFNRLGTVVINVFTKKGEWPKSYHAILIICKTYILSEAVALWTSLVPF